MAAKLWETGTVNAFNTTLNGAIDASVTTITLTTTTGLVAPGILCLDRQDATFVDTPTKREYISFTAIAGNDLTGCARGVAGSSAQAHASGAIVEENFSTSHWGEMLDYLQISHDVSGNITTAGSATISTLRLYSHLNASGASITGNFPLNPVWTFSVVASTASGYASNPLSMPQSGTLSWLSVTLDGPASGASYIFDVNKNGSSIFDVGARLTVPGGGTFASTASIATRNFVSGDKFWADTDAVGSNPVRVTIQGRA